MRKQYLAAGIFLTLAVLQGCSSGLARVLTQTPKPAPSVTPTASPSPSPTLTFTPTVTNTPTITPTASMIPLASATPGPTPAGGVSLALASISERRDGKVVDDGILVIDLNSGKTTQVLGEGYRLQDVSPDGQGMLVSKGTELWMVRRDGVILAKLSGSLFTGGYPSALWAEGGLKIAVIEGSVEYRQIQYINLAGYERAANGVDESEGAIALYHAGLGRIAWEYGSCGASACPPTGSRVSMTEASPALDFPGKLHPQVSPDGELLAYTWFDDEEKSRLGILSLNGAFDRQVKLEGDHIMAYAWRPDGAALSVLDLVRSDYSGRWFGINHFLVSPANWSVKALNPVDGVNAQVHWSPDGTALVISGTVQTETGYQVVLTRAFSGPNKIESLPVPPEFTSTDFILLEKLAWLTY